ncbi:MAG: threonylcarbamoyl-AMP synthase [Parachlamydiales bacterium]|nr:threonylcarbamoyl-AMP synthase [Parachlamydiales bacterium]
MKTSLYSNTDLQKAAEALRRGEIIAFPTETVYGLGAVYDDEEALKAIYSLKKRQKDKALTIHLSDIAQLGEVVEEIPKEFYGLSAQFLPGPLTVIMRKKKTLSSYISSNDKVGVRIPSHPIARQLIQLVGKPIIGTSANLSHSQPAISAEQVLSVFQGKISAVLDGGECYYRLSSTVIDLVDRIIYRIGVITPHMIEEVVGKKFFLPS